jgi:hypothetical protein
MRSFPPGVIRSLDRPHTLSELERETDHEPLVSVGVLVRIGLLLLIVFSLAMAAQLPVSAPH